MKIWQLWFPFPCDNNWRSRVKVPLISHVPSYPSPVALLPKHRQPSRDSSEFSFAQPSACPCSEREGPAAAPKGVAQGSGVSGGVRWEEGGLDKQARFSASCREAGQADCQRRRDCLTFCWFHSHSYHCVAHRLELPFPCLSSRDIAEDS